MSHAKIVASSSALAFAFKGPKGSGMHLLRAVMTNPKWSCMIIDSSHAEVGDNCNVHVDLVPWECRWDPTTIRGFLELGGDYMISSGDWRASPSQALLRLNHTLHAVVMTSSTSLVSTCCLKNKCQRNSMKSLWLIPVLLSSIFERFHTSLVTM